MLPLEKTGVWPLSCSNTFTQKKNTFTTAAETKFKFLQIEGKVVWDLCETVGDDSSRGHYLSSSGKSITALAYRDVEDQLLDLDVPHGVR